MASDDNKIYVCGEAETNLAARDEIVNLVKRAQAGTTVVAAEEPVMGLVSDSAPIEPPRTGVEIVETKERKGVFYHTMRDLSNDNVVKNVTRKSARRLWRYAITQAEDHPIGTSYFEWHGDIGLLKRREHAGRARYDLVQLKGGKLRVYYGVTEDGIHGEWARLVGLEADLPTDEQRTVQQNARMMTDEFRE